MEQPNAAWRWLESCPNECASEQNLRIDQAIFEAHQRGLVPATIRLYTWDSPVVSLGRHQSEEPARREFPSSRFVRRTTGGLAVRHGDDLTISIIASDPFLPAKVTDRHWNVLGTYFVLLAGVIAALRESGVEATTGLDTDYCSLSADCFAHLGRCDVYDAKTTLKLLGSAQRRTRGFVLQQMSLRPVQGLDVHAESFRFLLKRHFQQSLCVEMWQNETAITHSEHEHLRSMSTD